MGVWTLEHDEVTQTFAQWGLCQPVISFVSFDVSTASFDHTGAEFDSAPLFAFKDDLIIRLDDVIVFRGQVRATPRGLHGSEERIGYEVADVWWNLTRLPFQQQWAHAGLLARVVLFAMQNGTALAAAGVLEEIIGYAAECGAPVQFGTATGITIIPVGLDAREITCAEALLKVRAWCPDVATRMDYTTSPTTVSFIKRADADTHTLAALHAANDLDITPLHEQRVSQVVIIYEQRNMVDGKEQMVPVRRVYPPGSDGKAEGAVVMSVPLGGYTRQKQSLSTVNISANSKAWWERHYPWLKQATGVSISGGAIVVPVDGGEDAPNTYGWVYEITDGAVPSWIEDEHPVTGTVKVTANATGFSFKGSPYSTYPLTVTMQATSLAGQDYFRFDTSSAEDIPTGVEEAYFNATNPLHWQGQYVMEEDEISLTLPRPGDVLNLAGGQAEARGWTTMNAHVQSVELDVQMGRTSIGFGQPEHLGVQDLIAMMRARQGLQESQVRLERAGSSTGGRQLGPRSTANRNSVPEPQAVVSGGTQLVVSQVSTGVFTITSGTVNGVPVRNGSVGGSDITNISPPSWSISDGVLYLGIKWNLTFERDTLTSATGPICFVASGSSMPSDDESGGNYVVQLANIVGGVIADNFSPRKSLWCKAFDAGAGDGRAQITLA